LLAEDEETVLNVTRDMLKALNYRVLTADNGREALKVYKQHRDEIALVLMDMIMSDMGDKELLYALRGRYPDVKVAFMSGYPLGGEEATLKAQGV